MLGLEDATVPAVWNTVPSDR